MATYGSNYSEQPGQYPADSWTQMGLPAQNFGSGAPGSAGTDSSDDAGGTVEPGQHPSRETFTGVPLGGSGAPGTAGIPRQAAPGPDTGPDSVTWDKTTLYKSEREDGPWDTSDGAGYKQSTT